MSAYPDPLEPWMYDETCETHGLWWSGAGNNCPECVDEAERAAIEALQNRRPNRRPQGV